MTQRLKLAGLSLISLPGTFAFPFSAQQTDDLASQPFSPAPYRVGERLTYDVSFSSFISAAHVELLVAARGTFFGREGIQLKGHVETNGVVNAALFAINNDYISYVDPATGLPFHGEQTIREASRVAETSADFNQPIETLLFRRSEWAKSLVPTISCQPFIAFWSLPLASSSRLRAFHP